MLQLCKELKQKSKIFNIFCVFLLLFLQIFTVSAQNLWTSTHITYSIRCKKFFYFRLAACIRVVFSLAYFKSYIMGRRATHAFHLYCNCCVHQKDGEIDRLHGRINTVGWVTTYWAVRSGGGRKGWRSKGWRWRGNWDVRRGMRRVKKKNPVEDKKWGES